MTVSGATTDLLATALHEQFGHREFRAGQEEAAAAALDGRDALVVMPTGAGKSLTYQLPALCHDDLTLVVSPLVSLMRDQVDQLNARSQRLHGHDVSGLLSGQQDVAENFSTLDRAVAGELRMLYVAPERFGSSVFLERIAKANVGLFVVDEAHCVSQWGHDFRPDYFRLADAARWLKVRSILAATATATPQVAIDIQRRLGLRDPVLVRTGFDRPTLSFAVRRCAGKVERRARLVAALSEPDALPAIVYAGTRDGSEEVAALLQDSLGVEVLAYHAGLDRDRRDAVQRRFMSGEVKVICATNAFGMGVDKADVRTVVHDSAPAAVEAWYQEAGRAGRDGQPARAILLADGRDKGLHRYFIERAEVDRIVLDRVAAVITKSAQDGRFDVGLSELDKDSERARSAVGHLTQAGLIRPAPSAPDRVRGRLEHEYDLETQRHAEDLARDGQQRRWAQYRALWKFVESETCRRQAVLDYFGDPSTPRPEVPCCDFCEPSLLAEVSFGSGRRSTARANSASARAAASRRPAGNFDPDAVDASIIETVSASTSNLGRTRVVQILCGARSKKLVDSGQDGLPAYARHADLRQADVMERVDALLESGSLLSSGGPYPVLSVAEAAA